MGFRPSGSDSGTPLKYCDYLRLAGDRSRIPEDGVFYVVSNRTKSRVADSSLKRVHRPGKSWEWETDRPDCYPEHPFLLTDVESYKCIFHGSVTIDVASGSEDPTHGLPLSNGHYLLAVSTDSWLGELCVASDVDWKHGTLTAFSIECDQLPTKCEPVHLSDYEEVLGSLIPV